MSAAVLAAGWEPSQVLEHAHKLSVRVPADEQAEFLQQVLGARLAAASLGLRDTRTLSSWARGGPIKAPDAEHRLQVVYRVVTAVETAFGAAVAAAFMRGANPVLRDRAPLVVAADDPPGEAEPRLLGAVEALLTA